MGAVSGAIGHALSKVVPLGLGTGDVESFTGYAARMSARVAVPTPIFVRRVFQDAQGGGGLPVVAAARRLKVGDRDSAVATAVGRLTGHSDLDRPSYFAFLEFFGVGDRGVLVLHRRWYSQCWRDDGEERYERRVWWLALVDVCQVHGCLLEFRCPTCGRRQAALPQAVRSQVCSYCGHDPHPSVVVPVKGPTVERMLWYARDGARLVHAGEAIALTGSDKSESHKLAYGRLAELVGQRDLPAVERFPRMKSTRAVGSQVEALMIGLCGARRRVSLSCFCPLRRRWWRAGDSFTVSMAGPAALGLPANCRDSHARYRSRR